MRRALLIALGAACVLTACAGRPDRAGEESGPVLPEDRLALPTYDLAAYETLLDRLRGTPVVVNFWGSWCPPCEAEAPGLAEVSSEFQGRVQFLGVDILDARPAARQFILRFDWQYPSVFDPDGAIRDGLGYVGQPITLIYDREGELVWEHTGTITAELLREQIAAVL